MADFLQQLQESIKRLDDLNAGITESIQKKQQFTANIKQKLAEINTQVQSLVATMDDLKNRILGLQKEVSDNSGSIDANQNKIQELTQQNTQLQQEKASLEKQVQDLQAQYNNEKTNLEAEIARLQQENQMLQKQVADLTQEIHSSGNQLQEQHAQQLADLQAECKKKMDENAAQIQTLTQQLQDRTQDRNKRIADSDTRLRELQTKEEENGKQITDLTAEVTRLTSVNANLEGSIQNAITALNSAADEITKLINAAPNDADQAEIEQMLKTIKKTIADINAAIPPAQGSGILDGLFTSSPSASSSNTPSSAPNPTVDVNGNQISIKEVLRLLRKKDDQIRNDPNNKYKQAINSINTIQKTDPNITNPANNEKLKTIFASIAITPNSNGTFTIKGGEKTRTSKKNKKSKKSSKKTKKIRQQKGGYTYKDTKTGGFVINKTKKYKRSSNKSTRTSSR